MSSKNSSSYQPTSWIRIVGVALLFFFGQCSRAAEETTKESPLLDSSTLVQVQAIFRHGHRTPEFTFPKDPNKKLLEEVGLAQLTNVGKEQMYELGNFFRKRYGSFLNTKYVPREVEALSSDKDRTISSALCVLAGCYPPASSQVWTGDFLWQPIPVRMLPINFDQMLYVGDTNCDRRMAIFSKDYRPAFDEENKELYKLLTELAEFNVSSSEDVRTISESYSFAKETNTTLPKWMIQLEDKMPVLKNVSYNGLILILASKYMKYLGVGSLVGEIFVNMKNKSRFGDLDFRQLSIFATHDSTVYGFMSILGVYNDIQPPLASAILVEQHKGNDGVDYVQMLYRNDTSKEPIILRLPNCQSNPCSLKEFEDMTASLIPKNVLKECSVSYGNENHWSNSKNPTSTSLSIGQSLWIMFGVVTGLALVIIVVGAVVMKKSEFRSRRGYSRLGKK